MHNKTSNYLELLGTRVLRGSKFYLVMFKTVFSLGKLKFIPSALARWAYTWPRKEMIIQNKLGKFLINTHDDTYIHSSINFEKSLQQWLKGNNNTFVDVGANIGFYSLLAQKRYGFKKIVAFEPSPYVLKFLQRNIELNKLSKVKFENIALSNVKGNLFFDQNLKHTGSSKIVTSKTSKRVIKVKAMKFDDYKINCKEISLIKIDVEGHELEVLQGMQKTLKKMLSGTRIFVETYGKNKNEVLKLLIDVGFTLKAKGMGENYLFLKE